MTDSHHHSVIVRIGVFGDYHEMRHEFTYEPFSDEDLRIMQEEIAWALWVRWNREHRRIHTGPGRPRNTAALGSNPMRDSVRLIFDGKVCTFPEVKDAQPPWPRDVVPPPSVEFHARNVPQWWDDAPNRKVLGDNMRGVLQ